MYVRECGQNLSLFAIWNERVHSMGGGMVYMLCGWSVVRPMALTVPPTSCVLFRIRYFVNGKIYVFRLYM